MWKPLSVHQNHLPAISCQEIRFENTAHQGLCCLQHCSLFSLGKPCLSELQRWTGHRRSDPCGCKRGNPRHCQPVTEGKPLAFMCCTPLSMYDCSVYREGLNNWAGSGGSGRHLGKETSNLV